MRLPKVIGPVLVVKLTPVLVELVTDVLAKLNAPLEVFTLMPIPVGLEIVVEPVVKVPAIDVKLIAFPALLVDEMLAMFAVRVPLERLSAWPFPFSVTSEILSVTKPEPVMSGAALPPVYPRRILFCATVIPMPALVTVTNVPPGLVAGSGSLPAGGTTPEMFERVSVASCPMNFWPFSKVKGPT